MSRPAASPSFVQRTAGVVENVALARQTYRIRLHVPELARRIRPGQFLMLRLPGSADPLLGRPFALYDTVLDSAGEPVAVDVVYLVVGKLTGLLAAVKAGEAVEVWGPLGNGFPSYEGAEHVGLVAGGIGQTPFLAYVRQLLGTRGYGGRPARREAGQVSLYYGVRSAALAAGVEDFRDGRAPPSTWPATTAVSVARVTSPKCCVGCPRHPTDSSAADPDQCYGRWQRWPANAMSLATCRSRRQWLAASGFASAALRGCARPRVGTTAASVSRGRFSTRPSWIGTALPARNTTSKPVF